MNKSSKCAVCCNVFRASICATCVNHRLNEYKISLDSMKSRRRILYLRLNNLLIIKGLAIAQQSWRDTKKEQLARLRNKLQQEMEQLQKRKTTIGILSRHLKERDRAIKSANIILENNRVGQLEKHYPDTIGNYYVFYIEVTSTRLYKQALVMKQICKLFPLSRVTLEEGSKDSSTGQYDQICNARLPQGLNPLSVPPIELSASLGYMVQLLNLVVRKLSVPTLHNLGFGGSCSRIWQRDSYWNTRPSSLSNEYPLFIPSNDYDSSIDRAPANFGVISMKSEGNTEEQDPYDIDDVISYSSSTTLQSHDPYRDLQKGIALLKQSVAHITMYGYTSLYLNSPSPSTSSTFEAFAKLLSTLSSFKEAQSALSMGLSRSNKQCEKLNKSVWNLNSSSCSTLLNSFHSDPDLSNCSYYRVQNPGPSYKAELKHNENSMGSGWNLVEHPESPQNSNTNS